MLIEFFRLFIIPQLASQKARIERQDAKFPTGCVAGDILRTFLYQVAAFLVAMTFAYTAVYPVRRLQHTEARLDSSTAADCRTTSPSAAFSDCLVVSTAFHQLRKPALGF